MKKNFTYLSLVIALSLNANNFSDSKKILLKKIYIDNQNTFYCNNPYKIKKVEYKEIALIEKNEKYYSPNKIFLSNGNLNERAKKIEWEHVVPAYTFGHHLPCWQNGGRKACKKDLLFNEIESDMHNLVPAIGEVNEKRSNYKYGYSEPKKIQFGNCEFEIDFKYKRAYPKDDIRGDIARIYFYMNEKYKIELSAQEKKMFEIWNKQDPVSKWERIKNNRVEQYQGNRNKFIDNN
jgi:deoxyribonuclease I